MQYASVLLEDTDEGVMAATLLTVGSGRSNCNTARPLCLWYCLCSGTINVIQPRIKISRQIQLHHFLSHALTRKTFQFQPNISTSTGCLFNIANMVLRADGEQIGVQIDEDQSKVFSQTNLAIMAIHPFKFAAPPDGLQDIKLSPCRIIVGIMPDGTLRNDKDEWVWVVAVCEKHPRQQVHFVATQRCVDEDDREGESNLPRVVTFAELQEGELVGRFERCKKLDILWFMDYMQHNKGKAIKIHEVD